VEVFPFPLEGQKASSVNAPVCSLLLNALNDKGLLVLCTPITKLNKEYKRQYQIVTVVTFYFAAF
jgi:hypothetical protein